MRRSLFVTAVAAAAFLTLPTSTPAQAQQRPSAFAGDARFDRIVTVRWKKTTLYDALQELSKATGARLSPERSLVDEPVMASMSGVPARRVLDELGTLLHFTWARSGGTPEKPNYLLYQSKSARDEEAAMIDGAKKAVREALDRELARYRKLASMPPDQLQREVETADRQMEAMFARGLAGVNSSPAAGMQMLNGMAVRSIASPSGRAMLDLLNGLPQQYWTMLEAEQPIIFSTRPAEGELPLPGGFADRLRTATPGFPFPRSLFKSLGPGVEEGIGQAEQMMQKMWGEASGFKVTVQMSLGLGSQPMGVLRVNPEPMGGQSELGPLFAMSGINIISAPTLFTPEEEDPKVREQRLSMDPLLGKKAVIKLPKLEQRTGFAAILGTAYPMADVITAVEDAYGVKVVSDAYNRQAMGTFPPPPDNEQPLFKVLDDLAGMTRAWAVEGTTVRFRSKTWAHDRRAEIPLRYMRQWIDMRTQKGGFSLDDLAEIARLLRDEQIDSLMYAAMELGNSDIVDFVMIPMNRQPLRFYASLLPLQRRALLEGKSIPASSLYPYQRPLLASISQSQNQSMFSFAMGAKPARSPQRLAVAVVSLERQDIGARAGGRAAQPGGAPEGPPAQQAQPPMAPPMPVEQAQPGAAPQPQPAPAAPAGQPAGAPGQSRGQAQRQAQNNPFGQGTVQAMYTLRIAFPDGQKDEFRIPVTRPAAP